MGTTLSGGQAQRVMLARALYRQPALLVMDEGTSQLDVETEARINAHLKALDITRVAAAHRPQTLAAADRVLTLQEGRVVELPRPAPDAPQAQPQVVTSTDRPRIESIYDETAGFPKVNPENFDE